MGLLFRLPLMLLELLVRRVFGRDSEQDRFAESAATAAARPAPPPDPPFVGDTGAPAGATTVAPPPPPSVDEVIERRETREAEAEAGAATGLGSVTPLRPIAETQNGHVDSEPELVESFGPADDVGGISGAITVDEPWDGYAGQPASAIVARLRGADPATKAVVALYEGGHKNRATVIKATR
jgi:hypothetical protein